MPSHSAPDSEPQGSAAADTSVRDRHSAQRRIRSSTSTTSFIKRGAHLVGILGTAILIGAGVVWTAVAKQVQTVQANAVIGPKAGLFTVETAQVGQVSALGVRVGSDVRARGAAPMAIGLYPAGKIDQISVGQKADVAVNGVDPSKYGFALGRVVAIGPIPVTNQRLSQLTGNSSLQSLVAQLGPLREVDIKLERAATPSGLKWSAGTGPASRLPIGVLAAAKVTVGKQTILHQAFG